MARILIVAGGCRGRRLARELVGDGHAVRITTRAESGRAAIEATGAECWIGTPARLSTLRGALESVTIVCWLLGSVTGAEEDQEIRALHASRLEFFLGQVIDTTVRGFVHEATATNAAAAAGEAIVRSAGERNAIPVAFVRADVEDHDAWRPEARGAIDGLLRGPPDRDRTSL